METFLQIYNGSIQGTPYTKEQLNRLFGVFDIPASSVRFKIL
jgi:hypothetical protein